MIQLLIPFTFILSLYAMGICPPGTITVGSLCKLCPPGNFNPDENATKCQRCPAGTYLPVEGGQAIDACIPCPSGTFNPNRGSSFLSDCKSCPDTLASDRGADRCISCPPGTRVGTCPAGYDLVGIRCLDCPFGETSCFNIKAESKCYPCRDHLNEFNPLTNAFQCQGCQPGFESSKDLSKCVPCRVPNCRLCPSFQVPAEGGEPNARSNFDVRFTGFVNSYCKPCPAGFIGNRESGATTCKRCPAKTARQANQDYGNCEKCKKGENVGVSGAHVCAKKTDECPSGFFRDVNGACVQCTSEEFYDSPRKQCVKCKKNTVSRGGLDKNCEPCGRGAVKKFGECRCRPGKKLNKKGNCQKCPPGSRGTAGKDCEQCPRGTFQPKAGADECLICPEGSFQSQLGQTKCDTCSEGLFLRKSNAFALRESEACVEPATNCPPGMKRAFNRVGRFVGCE